MLNFDLRVRRRGRNDAPGSGAAARLRQPTLFPLPPREKKEGTCPECGGYGNIFIRPTQPDVAACTHRCWTDDDFALANAQVPRRRRIQWVFNVQEGACRGHATAKPWEVDR